MNKIEKDNIIAKIKKLLILSNDKAATEAEVYAAILAAQKLLAKYNLNMEEIKIFDEEKDIIKENIEYGSFKGYTWAKFLGIVIAENYCCKCFIEYNGNIIFYGFKEHTEIAKEVFKFLFNIGHNQALTICREYTKRDGHSRGVYNSYTFGFTKGVKSVLDEQCVALKLVVPAKVEQSYENLNLQKSLHTNVTISRKDKEISSKGYIAGRQAINQRSLEG